MVLCKIFHDYLLQISMNNCKIFLKSLKKGRNYPMMSRKTLMGAVAAAMLVALAAPGTMASAATTTAQAVAKIDSKVASDSYLKQNAAKYNLPADLNDLQYVTT